MDAKRQHTHHLKPNALDGRWYCACGMSADEIVVENLRAEQLAASLAPLGLDLARAVVAWWDGSESRTYSAMGWSEPAFVTLARRVVDGAER